MNETKLCNCGQRPASECEPFEPECGLGKSQEFAFKAWRDMQPYQGATDRQHKAFIAGFQAARASAVPSTKPVAWGMRDKETGEIVDSICPAEHDREPGSYTVPLYEGPVVPEGWTDADADAARLALELECLLTDKDMPTAVVSRWWDSAHEALALHRARLHTERAQNEKPASITQRGPTDCRAAPCLGGHAHSTPEGYVLIPRQVVEDAIESLGNFTSDLGWGEADMQAMDNLIAVLAAAPSKETT